MWKNCLAPLALVLSVGLAASAPSESALTYQGYVEDNGQPLNNTSAEMRFRLYDADSGGTQQGPEIVKAPGDVSFDEGLFTTELDFGTDPFNGTQLWLEIEIEGDVLSPRTKLTASAYSLSTRGVAVDADGNVGIGTADPMSRLDVDGEVRTSTLRATGGGNSLISFNPNGETASFNIGWLNDTPRIRIGGNGAGANSGFDIQRIGNESLLRIDGDGRLGIREGSPDLRLTLDQQGLGIDDPASQTLSFHTNGSERMRIDSSGRIGIGTDAPGAILDAESDFVGDEDPLLGLGNVARFSSTSIVGGPNRPTVSIRSVPGIAALDVRSVDFANLNFVSLASARFEGTTAIEAIGSQSAIIARGQGNLPTIDIDTSGVSNVIGPSIRANVNTVGALPTTIAVFQRDNANVARIGITGHGFFNDGTQNSGADVAEFFAVEGSPADYEPGDLLVISTETDRTVTRSAEPYCTLVAGVHATKPGVLLSERGIDEDHSDMVPMGVVGVVPTKVSAENGPIRRGDLLVSSSTPGHAMKGTDRSRLVGAIIGKALEDFDGADSGTGVIRVMVTCK